MKIETTINLSSVSGRKHTCKGSIAFADRKKAARKNACRGKNKNRQDGWN